MRIQPGTALLPPGELGLQCEVRAPWKQGLAVASRRWAQPAGAMERTLGFVWGRVSDSWMPRRTLLAPENEGDHPPLPK